MAKLIQPIEDLLKEVTDDSDRKALQASFEKYDFLQKKFEGNLRQEDYDKFMNTAKTEREKEAEALKTAQEYTERWKLWAERNVPKFEEQKKTYDELQEKYTTLEKQMQDATAKAAAGGSGGNTDVDANELLKRVREEVLAKGGYATESQVQKIATEEAKKMITEEASKLRDNFYKTDVPSVVNFVVAMNELQFRNRDEFGKALDTAAFSKYLTDNKLTDNPLKGYEDFTAVARKEKEDAKLVADTRKKTEEEYASKHNLPGSGSAPASELGPIQARQLNTNKQDESRPAWVLASEALRAEGKI